MDIRKHIKQLKPHLLQSYVINLVQARAELYTLQRFKVEYESTIHELFNQKILHEVEIAGCGIY